MTQHRHLVPYAGAEPRRSRITALDRATAVPYSKDEFLTVAEAAAFARCSKATIRNLYREHPIAKDVLGKILVSKSELLKLIDGA